MGVDCDTCSGSGSLDWWRLRPYIYIYIYIHIYTYIYIYIYICAGLPAVVQGGLARPQPPGGRSRDQRPQLPYSTLSANSVKYIFPFRACNNSQKQPPIYFRGGQIMASMETVYYGRVQHCVAYYSIVQYSIQSIAQYLEYIIVFRVYYSIVSLGLDLQAGRGRDGARWRHRHLDAKARISDAIDSACSWTDEHRPLLYDIIYYNIQYIIVYYIMYDCNIYIYIYTYICGWTDASRRERESWPPCPYIYIYIYIYICYTTQLYMYNHQNNMYYYYYYQDVQSTVSVPARVAARVAGASRLKPPLLLLSSLLSLLLSSLLFSLFLLLTNMSYCFIFITYGY